MGALLQDCGAFLVAMGAARVRGMESSTLLQTYALQVLNIPTAVWEEATSPAISQHVLLKHVRALYMKVEEQQVGSALDRTDIKYRETLTPEQTAALQTALPLMVKQELEDCLDSFVH